MVDRSAWAWWVAALLAVPTALAGLAQVWPGPPDRATAVRADGGVVTAAPPRGLVPVLPVPPVPGPASEFAALDPVGFGPDSAVLDGPAAATVAAAAAVLLDAPGLDVRVVGHVADTPGSPEQAQALSEERAAAVAAALVEAGVDPARIETVGRGAAEPLSTRADSRRVEFEIDEG